MPRRCRFIPPRRNAGLVRQPGSRSASPLAANPVSLIHATMVICALYTGRSVKAPGEQTPSTGAFHAFSGSFAILTGEAGVIIQRKKPFTMVDRRSVVARRMVFIGEVSLKHCSRRPASHLIRLRHHSRRDAVLHHVRRIIGILASWQWSTGLQPPRPAPGIAADTCDHSRSGRPVEILVEQEHPVGSTLTIHHGGTGPRTGPSSQPDRDNDDRVDCGWRQRPPRSASDAAVAPSATNLRERSRCHIERILRQRGSNGSFDLKSPPGRSYPAPSEPGLRASRDCRTGRCGIRRQGSAGSSSALSRCGAADMNDDQSIFDGTRCGDGLLVLPSSDGPQTAAAGAFCLKHHNEPCPRQERWLRPVASRPALRLADHIRVMPPGGWKPRPRGGWQVLMPTAAPGPGTSVRSSGNWAFTVSLNFAPAG